MQFGLSDKVVEKMRKVFETNAKVDKALVFGSRAKGNYREGSDIDIAIKGQDLNFNDLLGLIGKLDNLDLPYKIDLINYKTISEPDLKDHIDRVGIELYSRWKEYRFSDFVSINPTVSLKGNKEYSFVEMKDLEDGKKTCSPSVKRKASSGARFQERDTLFARITPCLENGKICQVRGLENGIGFGSTEFLVFRGRENVSDNDFVFYLSRWKEVRDFAESNFEGTSGRQRVPKDCFNNLQLELPPLADQVAIASILNSLDDKIDLLHRQNAVLEASAATIFKQWFVIEADGNWETTKISNVAKINKSTIDKNFNHSEIEYLDTGSITNGKIEQFQIYSRHDAPSRAQRLVRENDIVYSLVRPIQRHYGLMQEVRPNTVVSTGFSVISCDNISPYFIYLLLTQKDTIEYLDMVAEGSTSAYPSLRPSDIGDFEFQLPPDTIMMEFEQIAEANWKKIKSSSIQIRTLTQLRDTLLPMLMRGGVKVKMN